MDALKADRIETNIREAIDFLGRYSEFVRTSKHPSWQGKVKCRHCNAQGWPVNRMGSWITKHGASCKMAPQVIPGQIYTGNWNSNNSIYTYSFPGPVISWYGF